jgi:hypothetical protein
VVIAPSFHQSPDPAETRLKEGATALDSDTEQVGVFPCRGLVAPCQRAPGSIKGRPFDVNDRIGSILPAVIPATARGFLMAVERENGGGVEARDVGRVPRSRQFVLQELGVC